MANEKEGLVLTESNIHSDKVFFERRIKTFITALMKGIPTNTYARALRGKFGLIKAEIVDMCAIPKHKKENLRN